jgi:hypothetical protein
VTSYRAIINSPECPVPYSTTIPTPKIHHPSLFLSGGLSTPPAAQPEVSIRLAVVGLSRLFSPTSTLSGSQMCWRGFRGSGASHPRVGGEALSRISPLVPPGAAAGGGAHDPVGCAYKAASHPCQPVRVGGQGQRCGGAVPCGRCPEAFNQHIMELKGKGLTGVEDTGVLKLLKIRVCINLSELCLLSSGPSVTPACRV